MMTEMTVAARPFVRASEVWVPAGGGRLHLASGAYGTLDAFAEVSGETSFGRGEGLPGKAWDRGRPVILTGFRGSYFKRTAAAEAAGLTAAIALPVFAGDALRGVLVLFFGDDTQSVGAVEVWTAEPGHPMHLDDGYFGAADHFGWISGHTRFPKGQGLPGAVWAAGGPMIFRDLGASFRFLRSESAAEAGITAGMGLPLSGPDGRLFIITLLSAQGTPIARRFEVWKVEDGTPVCTDSIGRGTHDATAVYRAVETGVPQAIALPGGARVAIPVYGARGVTYVAAWSL